MRAIVCLFSAGVLVAACGGSDATTLFTPAGDGGTNNEGGNGTDGGGNPDGNPNPGNDGGNVIPDGGATMLACGPNLSCNLQVEQCCVQTGNGPPKYTCAATCPQNATALKCRSAADCGNDVCCASNTQPVTSQCKPQCAPKEAQLCDPDPKAPPKASYCGDAGACSSANIGDWGLPQGYGTCGGIPGPGG
jgi:hypothetical protein